MGRRSVKQNPHLDDLIAVISKPGKRTFRIEAWKNHEIMDELYWFGIDRLEAHDAAKRCARAHEELSFKIGKEEEVTIELKSQSKERKNGIHREQKKTVPESSGETAY